MALPDIMMKDGLIVEEHQVDGTRLFNFYRCINFFAILVSQVRCYCILYLQPHCYNVLDKIPCMNYIQIVVFLYIILRVIILFYFLCQ